MAEFDAQARSRLLDRKSRQPPFRTPLQFVAEQWQPGIGGAVGMGLRHGAYCVGCCGALMALLFVVGIMNLAWAGRLASGWGLIAAGAVLAIT